MNNTKPLIVLSNCSVSGFVRYLMNLITKIFYIQNVIQDFLCTNVMV